MDEFRARRVVDSLRDRGVNAHLLRGGNGKFGIRLPLPGGREAQWDSDGTASLEALVMHDGMLVGYVPRVEGSQDFDESRIVDAIIRTDYGQPVAHQRTVAPTLGPALSREGGVFRRFLDGFRYRLPSPDQRIAQEIAARENVTMTPQQKALITELRAADYPATWTLSASAADDKLVASGTHIQTSASIRPDMRRRFESAGATAQAR